MAVCHSTSMSSDTPPSLAGQLPLGLVYICKKMVGCQAAIASRLTPTVECVYLQEIGRLSGRLRGQASLLQEFSVQLLILTTHQAER